MTEQTTKAKVTTIKMGAIEFPGLRWEQDGEVKYGVAVSQLAEVNLVRQNQASRDLKSLLGKGFPFDKVASELNSRKVNTIDTESMAGLLVELAINGNGAAQTMLRALAGLSLTQLFADSFGDKFEKAERQAWLEQRMTGKQQRREFTDAVQDYLKRHPELSDSYRQWVYNHCSDQLNALVFGLRSKQMKAQFEVSSNALVRDCLTADELDTVKAIEKIAMRMIDADIEPKKAMMDAWNGAFSPRYDRIRLLNAE